MTSPLERVRMAPRMCAAVCIVLLAGLAAFEAAAASDVVRESIGSDAFAVLRNGRKLFLECRPPEGDSAGTYFKQFLDEKDQWKTYAGRGAVVVRFEDLNEETQRAVLLAIFEEDIVDEQGWMHVVKYSGRSQETLWTLCEWLTGRGSHYKTVAAINRLAETSLEAGQRVLFPRELLKETMRQPTPERMPRTEPDHQVLEWYGPEDLAYVTRDGRQFALYRLRPGEALYSSVVVRFTDFRDNADILSVCTELQHLSSIPDVRDMEPGTKVYVPVEYLSARFKPEGSPERLEYEEIMREAERLQGRVSTRELEGVVVILDAGHGGRDHGAKMVNGDYSLYEDEINYDIVCRIKGLIETKTKAKVHVLNYDRSQGYRPRNDTAFQHDTDEILLTTPPYRNVHAKQSVNLRWYLANSLYRRELKAGADPMKTVFVSVHTDAIYNEQLRGAMIYIPGARGRKDLERPQPYSFYRDYQEAREAPEARSTESERRRDEALSRNFAFTLLEELGRHRIKRHDQGNPIRSIIRQSGGVEYVPSVLRNTAVPTKVLVETANMRNPTDCKWLSDPWWRQQFAEAFVSALLKYYG